jgi:hypothetical protein
MIAVESTLTCALKMKPFMALAPAEKQQEGDERRNQSPEPEARDQRNQR